MKKIAMAVFVAMVIASCAKDEKSENAEQEQITLSATFSTEIKSEIKPENKSEHQTESRATATAFESGDELGLFVVKSGMEVQSKDNLVNNHKMVVGSDGVIKGTPTAVYYPTSSSQASSPTPQVTIHSYYPYQSGDATADALGVLVGIRTDQTDFLDVKRSDLCFGSARDIPPAKVAQPITFKHSFAQVRVNVTLFAGCPAIKQLRLINVKDSATLNMQTGVVTLKNHITEVLAYKSAENSYSTIIPAQTLNGACIAIDLVDNKTTYIFNAISPISLTQSATNTLNLTINDKGVASLSSTPAVTAWGVNNQSGAVGEEVHNTITLRWLAPHSDYATADKIVLTVVDLFNVTREIESALTLDPTSSAEYAVYTFPFEIAGAGYPMMITQARIYNGATLLRQSPQAAILGATLYRAGSHVMGLNLAIDISPTGDWLDVSGYGASRTVTVTTTGTNNWTASATGTGLSVSPTSGTNGQTATITWAAHYGQTIPAPRSGSVTFATVPTGATMVVNTTQNGENGPPNSVKINGIWWAQGNLVANGTNGCKIGAPTDGGLYFHLGSLVGWNGGANGDGTKTPAYGAPTTPATAIKVKPTGYSGSTSWPAGHTASGSVPTSGNASAGTGDACRYYLGGSWRLPTDADFVALSNAETTWTTNAGANGRWFGTNLGNASTSVFFPATGYRDYSNGSLISIGAYGYYWSSVQYGPGVYYLTITSSYVNPQDGHNYRVNGCPVRCVLN